MADVTIKIKDLTLKLDPIEKYKFFKKLPLNDPVKNPFERRNIYTWDCATQKGVPDTLPRDIRIPNRIIFRDFQERNARIRTLKEKASIADLLIVTDLSPSGLGTELAKSFPQPSIRPNWAQLVDPLKPNYSFTVQLEISYMTFVATPQDPRLRGAYYILRIPKWAKIDVRITGKCNNAPDRANLQSVFEFKLTAITKPLWDESLKTFLKKALKELGTDKLLLEPYTPERVEEEDIATDPEAEEITFEDFEANPLFFSPEDRAEITYQQIGIELEEEEGAGGTET